MSDSAGPARFPPEELLAHADWARDLAAHLVRDAATADDVAQDALVAAMRKPPLADRPLRPWLGAVVRKLALARRRGDGRRSRREDAIAAAAASRTTPSAAEIVARVDAHRVLAEAVAALAEPLRSTVYLHYYEGLDSAQIAERQGVAASTVRWRLAKALDELRVRLDGRSPGGRSEWIAALTPLAMPRLGDVPVPASPVPPGPAPVAAVVSGVLAMAMTMKVILGGAAIAAVLAVLWTTHVAEAPGSRRPAAAPVDLPPLPAATKREVPQKAPRRREAADAAETASTDTGAPGGGAPAATPPVSGRLEIRARVLDAAGVAAAGARVQLGTGESAVGGTGDSAGRISFRADVDPSATNVGVVVSAPGCATRILAPAQPTTDVLDLGDVRLGAGGTVAGRVVDAAGAAVAGATVAVVTTSTDGSSFVDVAPVATTVADGGFVLAGAPVGWTSLSFGAAGFVGKSVAVEVRASQESPGGVVVLERVDPSVRVSGVVETPDGAPAAGAIVSYSCEGGGGTGAGGVTADAAGRFDIEGGKGKVWRLAARDPGGVHSPVSVAGLRSGAAGIVLRLAAAKWAEVAVTRDGGVPVERFAVELRGPGGVYLDRIDEAAHAGGVARFRLPAQTFTLTVTAPGCAIASAGPLDPAKVEARVEVDAASLPGLSGIVTAGGAPVANALISLREFVPAGTREMRNGFPCVTFPSDAPAVRTGADGTFNLTLRSAGRFVVRAETPDLAAAEAGPFDVQPEVGRAGIQIALSRGGSIEGRVLVAAGASADGTIVGASRGDGAAQTVRANPDGTFRFDRLTPGQWLVRRSDREIRSGTVTVLSTVGEARLDWSCRVDDGATTHFDVDLRTDQGPVLRGDVRVDGAAAAGWRVTLMSGTALLTSEELATSPVAESGAYRLVAPGACEGLARITSPQRLYVFVPVKVGAAETTLAVELLTGQVRIAGASQGEPLLLLTEDGAGRCALAQAEIESDGTCAPTQILAGRVRLVRATRGEMDPRRWPTVAEGDLAAGGSVLLEVPAK